MRFWSHSHRDENDGGVRWHGYFKRPLPDAEKDCWACRGTRVSAPPGEPKGPCEPCNATGRQIVRGREQTLLEISVETSSNRKYKFCHGYVKLKSRGIQFAFAVPYLFSIWVTFTLPVPWGPLLKSGRMGYDSRSIGWAISHGKLRLELLEPGYGSTREPRWQWTSFMRPGRDYRRKFRSYPLGSEGAWKALDGWSWSCSINPVELLFGCRERIETIPLGEQRVTVPMPEGNYPATFTSERWIYARKRWPRWPFREAMAHGEITPDTPIPFPGKGENSWDCGDDATYSSSGPYGTPESAVAGIAQSVMRSRRLYGSGENWTPSEGFTVARG